jgi:acetyl esterase/lipase
MTAAVLLFVFGLLVVAYTANATWPQTQNLFLLVPSWASAWFVIEFAPLLLVLDAGLIALAAAFGAFDHMLGWVGAALVVLGDLPLLPMVVSLRRTKVTVAGLLDDLDPEPPGDRRFPRLHALLPFLMFWRRGVKHVRGVEFARVDGRRLKLDVYMPAAPASSPRPAIVQVHGGGWVFGSRREQAIPLLNHLAANGWVGFNIDYRLSPDATLPEHVIDVKRAIAWVREHAEEYGVDPSFIAITGGSAGGHLSALAALTSDDRSLQPGFEEADTSVAAAVPFYGLYDMLDAEGIHGRGVHQILEWVIVKARRRDDPERFRAISPRHRVHADAPPFLVIHGDRDSLLPVQDARNFAEALQATSRAPVVYAEMQGAQHAFDLIPSWRSIPVIESIERFLATVHARRGEQGAGVVSELEEALTE